MLRPSFVPPKPVRRLRDLTRYRADMVGARTAEKNRVEKLLEDAQIKLSVVASDIFGASGRDMMAALVAGERSPKVLAQLARRSMRAKITVLEEAFTGYFTGHHAFLLRQMLARVDAISADIAALGSRIEAEMGPFAAAVQKLDEVPGISLAAAHAILAETGLDMTRFPTAGHLASWAKYAPLVKESAGKKKGRNSTGHGSPTPKPDITTSDQTFTPPASTPGVADHDQRACGQVLSDLLEVRDDDRSEGAGSLVGTAEQDDARCQHGCVSQEFAEVGIGGDEDPVLPVRQGHDLLVGLAAQAEFIDMSAVVACGAQQLRHLGRQALIEQESHAVSRTGSSRSSTARAAYSRHACTSAGASCGYSATISSVVSLLATRPTIVATGIRVPVTQGTPPMIWWSTVIRARSMDSSWAVRLPAVKQARQASRGRQPDRGLAAGACRPCTWDAVVG
jgi:hypothetical protein